MIKYPEEIKATMWERMLKMSDQNKRLRYTDRRKNRLERRKKRSWIGWLWFLLIKPGVIRRSSGDRRCTGERRRDWVRCSPWVSIYAPAGD